MDWIPDWRVDQHGASVTELLIAAFVLGYLVFLAFVLALMRTAARAERTALRQRQELRADAVVREQRRRRTAGEDARRGGARRIVVAPYPGQGERPGPTGARAPGARPRPQR